ncbi:hypothetical protein PO909_031742, partial [Leuciscus waleckii]
CVCVRAIKHISLCLYEQHSQNDAAFTTQLQKEALLQQVKDVWRVFSNAQEKEGVNSFDWVCWLCRTRSSDSLRLLLTDQTGCHFKQDKKPRAMGDTRSV